MPEGIELAITLTLYARHGGELVPIRSVPIDRRCLTNAAVSMADGQRFVPQLSHYPGCLCGVGPMKVERREFGPPPDREVACKYSHSQDEPAKIWQVEHGAGKYHDLVINLYDEAGKTVTFEADTPFDRLPYPRCWRMTKDMAQVEWFRPQVGRAVVIW